MKLDKDQIKAALSVPALLGHYDIDAPEQGRMICPFCGAENDKPSAEISESHFYCFRCLSSFDIYAIIQEWENCTFTDALKLAAEYAGLANGTQTPEQKARLEERKQQAIAKRKEQAQELVKLQAEAAQIARDKWANAKLATNGHPYLKDKQVPSFGLRVDGGWLLVPVNDADNNMMTLQQIDATKKKFMPSGKKKGGFYALTAKDKSTTDTLYIAEGYSTAASVHLATGKSVLVAFDAGNLLPVAKMARDKYPSREIIIAADNDDHPIWKRKKNTGIISAEIAAQVIKGKIAIPKLAKGGKCDFNDLHAAEGLEVVKAQLEAATIPPPKISPEVEVPPPPPKWETPINFDEPNLTPLDPAFLPSEYREYCECISAELQVPIELVICVFFAMVGLAVQGKYVVQVKQNYIEELCTYWICLLPPSERKSPTMARLKKIVQQWERNKAEAMKPEIARRISERQTLQMTIEDRRKKASRAKNAEERQKYMAEIAELEEQLEDIIYPPRFFLDDATPESIIFELSKYMALGIIEAEGKLIDIIAGLYSKAPNFDVFLKAFSAEEIRVDRRNAPPIFARSPRLTMCLTIQPFVIQARAASTAFRGKGADSRINWLMPTSKVGFRDLEPTPTPDHVERKYHNLMLRLLDVEMPEEPHALKLSLEAYQVYLTLAERVEQSLAPSGDFANMQDWQGKTVGRALRIAGLMHCMEHTEPHNIPIQPETMNNACYFVEGLGEHAKAVYGLMSEPEQISTAKKALKWITTQEQGTFQARTCYQGIKGSYPTMEQVQKGLDTLEEHNFIRQVPQAQPRGKGKPPSTTYEVNPSILSK